MSRKWPTLIVAAIAVGNAVQTSVAPDTMLEASTLARGSGSGFHGFGGHSIGFRGISHFGHASRFGSPSGAVILLDISMPRISAVVTSSVISPPVVSSAGTIADHIPVMRQLIPARPRSRTRPAGVSRPTPSAAIPLAASPRGTIRASPSGGRPIGMTGITGVFGRATSIGCPSTPKH